MKHTSPDNDFGRLVSRLKKKEDRTAITSVEPDARDWVVDDGEKDVYCERYLRPIPQLAGVTAVKSAKAQARPISSNGWSEEPQTRSSRSW